MPMSQRPNILIIYTDQQRQDTLGCYGNSIVRTLHIDALAAGGTLIEDCQRDLSTMRAVACSILDRTVCW